MVSAAKAVLLDIDGTIMRAPEVLAVRRWRGAAALWSLPLAVAQAAVADVSFNGRTDRLIFADVAARAGRVDYDHDALIAAYLAALDGVLDTAPVQLMPGIAALVRHFMGRPGVQLGLLTGNVRAGAKKKLDRVALAHLTDAPGGFGDDGCERHDVAAVAMQRLAAVGVRPWGTLVVGDSVHDVRAAHKVGAPAVAVATGWTSYEELRANGAELVLRDLSNPGPLLDLLARL